MAIYGAYDYSNHTFLNPLTDSDEFKSASYYEYTHYVLSCRSKVGMMMLYHNTDTSASRIYKERSENGGQTMAQKKVYDNEFKIQAVKLAREIGFSKAAKELGIHTDTLYGWDKRAKDAWLDLEPGTQTPDSAMSLNEEVQKLRQQNKEQAKEINRLKEENEFLAEASAFFAASRRKSVKT